LIPLARILSARIADCLPPERRSMNYVIRQKMNLWIKEDEYMMVTLNGGRLQKKINKEAMGRDK
jgi:hypothetical protein